MTYMHSRVAADHTSSYKYTSDFERDLQLTGLCQSDS